MPIAKLAAAAASKLALKRSKTASIRAFADDRARDHPAVNDKALALVRKFEGNRQGPGRAGSEHAMKVGRLARVATLSLGLACPIAADGVEAKTLRVRIVDMAFQPAAVSAAVGDVVEWSNDDFVDHSATSSEGRFDVTIPAGKTGTATMTRPGRFPYACRFHPNMAAIVEVK